MKEEARNLLKTRCNKNGFMKQIGQRYFNDAPLRKVFTILGYDIYVPDSYYNPLSFLKNGCPMWLLYDDVKCDIYECVSEDTVYSMLADIIKAHYPRRKGYYCKPLSLDITKRLHLENRRYKELSTVCYDENDNIKALILIEDNERLTAQKGFKCASISYIINKDDNAVKILWEYISDEININRYRGLLISYDANCQCEIDYAHLINMLKKDDGKYYYQFE